MNYNDPYGRTEAASLMVVGTNITSPQAYTSSYRSQHLIQRNICDMCSDKDLHARCTTKK